MVQLSLIMVEFVLGLSLSLDSCDSYKYLGVYIERNLSCCTHVDYLCRKIAKGCGGLEKCVLPRHLSILTFAIGIAVWGNASAKIVKPLQGSEAQGSEKQPRICYWTLNFYYRIWTWTMKL